VRRLALSVLVALAALVSAAAPLAAQRGARVEIALPPSGLLAIQGPTVRTAGLLTDRQTRDLLRNGFPARLHFRVELWASGGLFDDLKRQVEWDVVVRHDPLLRTYQVARIVADQVTPLGSFEDVQGAQSALERPFQVPLAPGERSERLYYNVLLEVEMLSLNDLDEVERWLKGELRPAVRGERNPGTALTRGVRTLFVRLMGGEKRTYRERSGTFRTR
jgi:hypothetical protein